jgi:hypothetical protein
VLKYEQETIFIMNRQRNRLLFILLCFLVLCSSSHALILQITVQDSTDNSIVPRATVFINGVNFGRTNSNGQVFFNHSGLNDTLVRVSMTGYDDWEKTIEKNETSVFANLSRRNINLKVTLYDSDSLGVVSGAKVNISSGSLTESNVTDISGAVTFTVSGTTSYSINITDPRYQSRSGIIDTGTENVDAQYWMLPINRFTFIVKDKGSMAAVPDAEVWIDNALTGKTDTRGALTISLDRGKVYSIEIRKAGYQTLNESRSISEIDAFYSVVLQKALLGAFISVFDENRIPLNSTDIYINGTLAGTTNQFGRGTFPTLVSGSYQVEVRKTGYASLNRTIVVISPGEDFDFEMPFGNANLTVFVEENDQKIVPNATILINDHLSGLTDNHGQYHTQVKFNTLYNITAVKDTYQTVSIQNQFLQGNESVSVTLVMQKNLDWGLVTLILVVAIGVLILIGIIRRFGGRKRRHVMRKNEI